MRKLLLGLMLLPCALQASPYFRVLHFDDPKTFHVSMGRYIDPANVNRSESGGQIAVVFHDHRDGYLFLKGEDYSLLSVGGVFNGAGSKIAMGPQFDVSEPLKALGLSALNYVSPRTSLIGIKQALAPAQDVGGMEVNLSMGPAFVFDPSANKGFFRIFLGGKLVF